MSDKLFDNIQEVNIVDEMRTSYIDYAMSVIVGRALPDVRDGLKPVHRRILYSMDEIGMGPDKAYKKSARLVGDVLGKYHPHGDSAVYDAMVRMAQDFSIRYPLVDGHGNFGSIDGDSAAAMRYTEARMTRLAAEMLKDIDKNTVDFVPNFDESLKEPSVLPAKFPNLLVNGSSGIAVGMATNIPPHNLGEVIDGLCLLIDNPDCEIEDLIKYIKGPDFPTGGMIMGKNGIYSSYRTGRGMIKMRAQTVIEEDKRGRERIVITEIPYQVNKARLVEKIADLVKEKKIEGISDIRDESNREGMRIAIDLKKDISSQIILNLLYKYTQMQETFGVILLALVNNEPKVLNLKEILYYYLEHQKEILIRRTKYDLEKAEERAHILEGLRIALENIDEVVEIIKTSKDVSEARTRLIERFGLSEKQSQAILDMRLQRLTALETEKIESEYKQLLKLIEELTMLLGSEKLILDVIKKELIEIKEKFNNKRRTVFADDAEEMTMDDFIEKEDIVITLTHVGYIKRISADTYSAQKRGGKGITALSTRENDFIQNLFTTSTKHFLLFFTNKGRVYRLKAYEIPEASRTARGMAIVNILQMQPDEKITEVFPVEKFEEGQYLLMATAKGLIKKTSLNEYDTSRKTGIIGINLDDDDELIGVKLTSGEDEVVMGTQNGYAIRFAEEEVRPIGRSAKGVKGISLRQNDTVIGMDIADDSKYILCVSENGYGKLTAIKHYRKQNRAGKGMLTYNITAKTGELVGFNSIGKEEDLMMINNQGIAIRLEVNNISSMGRAAQGVRLQRLKDDEKVVTIAKMIAAEEEENGEE
ncbi:MAG: DNA gyrase subunit A [Eubacteriaceae bacterium]